MSFQRPTSIKTSVVAAALALAAGCSSNGGGGGSPGTAGSTGTGTAGSSGGGSNGLGSGGPFTFPQNKMTGACTLTTVANAASATQSAYNSWKSTFVVAGNPGLRVQRPENGNDTVSEGIGYGMLAAVYMGDQTTFDGLWTYAQAHFDNVGLMNWHIGSNGTTASGGANSATDGDEDIAWALLMASDQWNSQNYLNAAVTMINAMFSTEIFSDGSLQSGDHWSNTDHMNPDYFSPAYYRVFAKATDNPEWSGLIVDAGYTHLSHLTGSYGLVPNASNIENTIGPSTGNTGTCIQCDPVYGYDACRTPWRIAMDYCWNGETRAQAYLQKAGGFFNNIGGGPGNICDSYNANGTQGSSCNHNLAFIGPAGVSGMAGFQSLLDGSFNLMVNPPGGNTAYFPQSLRVLSMLMMTGNFLDYTQLQ